MNINLNRTFVSLCLVLAASCSADHPMGEAVPPGAEVEDRRIDLDFENADVRVVLDLLAELGMVNIIVSDETRAAVTIRESNVTWSEAMHAILRSTTLTATIDENEYHVASVDPSFSGGRIDLDFKDADVNALFSLFAQVGQVEIVTSEEVNAAVTIRMMNAPWDQALDYSLQSAGLTSVRDGDTITVSPMN